MTLRPQARPGLLDLRAYTQGKGALRGVAQPIKLSSNESSYGPSPLAKRAFLDSAAELHRYPDGAQLALRSAIAATHGLKADQIICGNGSEELIGLLIRAYVAQGEEIVLSDNHFMMCPIYGRTQGAHLLFAPERDDRIDVDAILALVSPATRTVILANPNNPTGTYLSGAELHRLHDALPPNVLLLVDGAYAEYVMAGDYEDGAALVERHDNVVMTRSFSKIHGLAGLRIGWAYCPAHVIDVLQRIRTPFNANRAALAAAAAAVADVEYVSQVRSRVAAAQSSIRQELLALGVRVIPSVTNFYLLDFAGMAGFSAREASAFLESRGVIPRPIKAGRGENMLRITIGLDEENAAALAALRDYLGARAGN